MKRAFVRDISYSYRSASMGSRRDALRAGQNPLVIPTSDRIVNDTSITPSEALRKISPW